MRHLLLGVGISAVAIASSSAQVKTARRVGLLQYLQISHTGVTRDLLAAAALMPAADYDFKPTTMAAARSSAA